LGLLLCIGALSLAPIARASPADDGEGGLKALDAGDYDHAIALFTRALQSNRLVSDDRELALASRGKAYLKKGDASAAIADLDAAQRLKSDDADARNDLETALVGRGQSYLKDGNTSLAIVDLDRARQIEPDNADAQNGLAGALALKIPVSTVPGAEKLQRGNPWSDLGNAVLAGAIQGVADGLASAISGNQPQN
jgi:tetratricopeptide (TPR) repeat protein